MQPILRAENVHKSFDKTHILKGVSFQIEEGDLVSIIGPSGCGKSTLLRCLNGLETLDSGMIEACGVRLERKPGAPEVPGEVAHRLRRNVGMVFQQYNLFPHKTLLQNVMMAPMVVKGTKKEEAEANAERLLKKVGLYEQMDRYPINMSGGQQQRGAIARALAMAPKIMLYDEPTSALDPGLVDEVLDVMKELDAEGMTQIVVTHEMRFARDASDYIIYMEKGDIVEISDEDEIFENPKDPRTRQFLHRFA
ncbi:amino acid ABC transporter ATP-binding protein [Aquabacter spiritensis]|uniref:Amino acid ABC transporter ATP-binding protein (PAAT family) n=1 Tax=Aquabacter spiritensis TaxID=933073 RepID=A0A4R3LLH2_9HYPH|nr:amino acid ABC transporter ATP-binding protein [Aquabacter spiritensis]TCT01084.1 amino acid ABC transporter ATP-binding protein (PAAT family) [Aquabacter spiritensis]